jgi:uncharacterized protein
MEGETRQALPHLPFCSERCKLIDLGRWLGERYRFPTHDSGSLPDEDSDEPLPSS